MEERKLTNRELLDRIYKQNEELKTQHFEHRRKLDELCVDVNGLKVCVLGDEKIQVKGFKSEHDELVKWAEGEKKARYKRDMWTAGLVSLGLFIINSLKEMFKNG